MTGADVRQRCIAFSFRLGRCECEAGLALRNIELVRVLAHVVPDLGNFIELSGPLRYAVGRSLLLKPFQDGLVFHSNLHELVLALNAIQTGLLHSDGVVEIRSRVLHDVGHFLEQYAVFPLDLRIAPCDRQEHEELGKHTIVGVSLFSKVELK